MEEKVFESESLNKYFCKKFEKDNFSTEDLMSKSYIEIDNQNTNGVISQHDLDILTKITTELYFENISFKNLNFNELNSYKLSFKNCDLEGLNFIDCKIKQLIIDECEFERDGTQKFGTINGIKALYIKQKSNPNNIYEPIPIDLSFLKGLDLLEEVDFVGIDTSKTDFNSLKYNTELKELLIKGSEISKDIKLPEMKSVISLYLENVADANFLKKFPNLTKLSIEQNSRPIENMIDAKNIKEMELIDFQNVDKILANGDKLEYLRLALSTFSSLKFLKNYPKLDRLDLSDCEVTIDMIEELEHLRKYRLSELKFYETEAWRYLISQKLIIDDETIKKLEKFFLNGFRYSGVTKYDFFNKAYGISKESQMDELFKIYYNSPICLHIKDLGENTIKIIESLKAERYTIKGDYIDYYSKDELNEIIKSLEFIKKVYPMKQLNYKLFCV